VLSPLEARGRDQSRRTIGQQSATTNLRGFFQVTGIPAGSYTLVSRAPDWSPAVIPEVTVREGEALVWPKPIRHSPQASVDIVVDPPLTPGGKPWLVQLAEKEPIEPHSVTPPLACHADSDGKCSLRGLRADAYIVTVQDETGSVMNRVEADLAEGSAMVTIDARGMLVRGLVRFGDKAIDADLTFANESGRMVRTSTSDDGTFRAVFPVGGEWNPTIVHPRDSRTGSRLRAKAVIIPAAGEPSHDIEIVLPGGGIRGTVIDHQGNPQSGGVIVERDHRRVSSQRLAEDGTFEIIGLEAGSYQVWAQADKGASPHPIAVDLAEGESKTIELITEQYRVVSGTIASPTGEPASGALVRVSDDGHHWTSGVVADFQGRFKLYEPAETREIELALVTYSYPGVVVAVPPDQQAEMSLVLPRCGGVLRAKANSTWYVSSGYVPAPFNLFNFPEPYGHYNGGIFLACGTYRVCPTSQVSASCREVVISAGSEQTIQFSEPGASH
jgi:hypothetical protein